MKTLIKDIAQVFTIAALTLVLIFLGEDFIKEIETHKQPDTDFADVKGCDPDVWYEYQECA